MGDLTKNISRHELKCKCGRCKCQSMDFETINAVQEACDHFAKKLGVDKVVLYIGSAHRCQKHNDTPAIYGGAGGSKGSHHKLADAIDHRIKNVTVKELYDYYNKKYPDKYGLGLYIKSNFVHLDPRPKKARW